MPYYYTQQDGEGTPNIQNGNRPYDTQAQEIMMDGGGFIGPGLGPGGGGPAAAAGSSLTTMQISIKGRTLIRAAEPTARQGYPLGTGSTPDT